MSFEIPTNTAANHSSITTTTSHPLQDSITGVLPDEVIFNILKSINIQDIASWSQVSKTWNIVFTEKLNLWKEFFEFRFPDQYTKNLKSIESFHDACKNQWIRYSNLSHGRYLSNNPMGDQGTSFMKMHRGVFSSLISNGKTYYGMAKGAITVWDLSNNKANTILGNHISPISGITIDNGKLFTISRRGDIEIWDLETLSSELPIPTTTITGLLEGNSTAYLAVDNNKLFVLNYADHKIEILDLWKNELLPPLEHAKAKKPEITSFTIKNHKLYSAFNLNNRGTIQVWDLETNTLLKTIGNENEFSKIRSIITDNKKHIAIVHYNTISILDLDTSAHICTLSGHGHHDYISFIGFEDDQLISHSKNGEIRIWDLKTQKCIRVINTGIPEGTCSGSLEDGKMCLAYYDHPIHILDFNADNNAVFEQISYLLESENFKSTQEAFDRFSRMPQESKNKIYLELNKIAKFDWSEGILPNPEKTFEDKNRNGLIPPILLAQAIRNYLAEQIEKDSHPLLEHLEIVSTHDYLKKLGCTPQYLQKIGISSMDNLKSICSPSTDVQKVEILPDATEAWDYRDNGVKTRAEERKKALSDLTGQMAHLVDKKMQETGAGGMPLYSTKSPWIGFQNNLKAFQEKFKVISEGCDSAQTTVNAFKKEKYNELASELNSLVEEFLFLDREHQIAKLRAHISHSHSKGQEVSDF